MKDKRLYTPSYLKEVIYKHGFRFTKSLGQNFLIDGNIVRGIVDNSGIDSTSKVLEVGPGVGTLTEELAIKAGKVVSIEIDKSLKPILEDTLGGYSNSEIYFGDILKVDLKEIIEEKLDGGPVKVVANLPYYITTPILGRLLEEDLKLESITVMVQKEVADRIIAKPGSKNYSALSVFIDYYSRPEVILEVPRTVFMPQPNVDSAVVKLNIKEDKLPGDRKKFFKLVKQSFSMRRKTLLNCLSKGEFLMSKDEIKEKLLEIGIDPGIRAEKLGVKEFLIISENIE